MPSGSGGPQRSCRTQRPRREGGIQFISTQCRRSSRADLGGSFQGTPILDVDTEVIGNSVFADVGALRKPRRQIVNSELLDEEHGYSESAETGKYLPNATTN